ncbi:MAG: dethiobiotin synthase [Pseudomonadota bacterium]
MSQGWFITGTDTEIGKTWSTVLLMRELQSMGYVVNGMKPVASGAEMQQTGLRNEDALFIDRQNSSNLDYTLVNPVTFEPPIAPHIAASQAGKIIDINMLVNAYNKIAVESDIVLVEGVGGWRVPLGEQTSLSDLVRALQIPVILVVGLRLGCINHALLTAEVIRDDGIDIAGWISSEIEQDYLFQQHSVDTIRENLACPHLAEIPHQPTTAIDQAMFKQKEGFQGLFKSK